MSKKYIIAEGENDVAILKKILPKDLVDNSSVQFISGAGYSSAVSLASSLLYDRPDSFVILALDADTTDSAQIEARYDFIHHQLKRVSPQQSYAVFLFVPVIEALFANYPQALRQLADASLEKSKPLVIESFHDYFISQLQKKDLTLTQFLNNLKKEDIKTLQSQKPINQIIEALQYEAIQP